MSEFEDNFNDEFFVIDSNNLNQVSDRFYGYAITDEGIIFDEIPDYESLDGVGAYVLVKNQDDTINIYQDFNGCYGLYLYKRDGYFALSNSFMKLVDHVKFDHEITFNRELADSFLFADLCSYAYTETLVNEIEFLPRNYQIIIDKQNGEITFNEIDYEEQSVPIDSKEALDILDRWYLKYVNVIRKIKDKTNNFSVDLSGGFDSRIVSVLWLTANIDLDKVRVNTHSDSKSNHDEDYQIASKIAKEFNFKLNKESFSFNKTYYNEIETPVDISFYVKLGFHKQMYLKIIQATEPVYSITGDGGGSLKGFLNESPEEYIDNVCGISNMSDACLTDSTRNVVDRAFGQISEKFGLENDSMQIPEIHYKEVRNRHHCGKPSVESKFANWFSLSPLIDPDIRKIDVYSSDAPEKLLLLYALIFARYCPKLLDFEFEGGREIPKKALWYAKQQNEKYPFNAPELDFVTGPEVVKRKPSVKKPENVLRPDVNRYFKKVFYSDSFKEEFLKCYSLESYYNIVKIIESEDYHPYRHAFAAIAILKIISDTGENRFRDMNSWLNYHVANYRKDNHNRLISYLIPFNTARLDIKNEGSSDNNIEIISSPDSSHIEYPEWDCDENGNGIKIENTGSSFDIKLRCINDGKMVFTFRGIDFTSKNNERFPVYIDFTKFIVNGKSYLKKSVLVTHDKFHRIELDVKDSEILNIHVEWNPFNESSHFRNEEKILKLKIRDLNHETADLKTEVRAVNRRNYYLNEEIENMKNSRSWKLAMKFRAIYTFFTGSEK